MPSSIQPSIAIGMDIVSISRVSRVLSAYPERFRNFAFTHAEQKYCESQANPAQHYAARWAVKESYIKAINQPENIKLSEIELVRNSGTDLSLTGAAYEELIAVAADRGSTAATTSIDVSLTHEEQLDCASAFVVILFSTINEQDNIQ